VPIIVAGTLDLTEVARQQKGFFWNWYIFRDPFTFCAFWTFFTCATAGCKRAPFDLAEAESELVAGFHTEYSGFRWLIFFMAEYGAMVASGGIAILMFLGGWHTGLLPEDPADANWLGFLAGNLVNVAVFVFKCYVLVFVMMWVRWTLPRLRIDQVMMTCLKYILPISCALLVGVSLWRLAVPPVVQDYCMYVLGIGSVALFALMLAKAITAPSNLPSPMTPGFWMPGAGVGAGNIQQKV
jgi:NADH-quinone oxidoreductase subunit H